MDEPKRTPLYEAHQAAGARIVDFHGWLLPVQYAGILAEHHACRSQAALFDTSHMGQLFLRGPGIAEALAGAITQNAAALPVGRGTYGFLLADDGGILDDTVLIRLGEADFLLVVNASPQDADAALLAARLGGAGAIDHRRDVAKLDLQGPLAREILQPFVTANLTTLRYFQATRCELFGASGVLSRTGYTGELGYELFLPASCVEAAWDALLADDRVSPAGLGARDMLRLEMAYPLSGQDIGPGRTPIEADLAMFVDPARAFPGAEALRGASPPQRLAAFRGEGRRRAAGGQAIHCDGRAVGVVTSAGFSPSLGCSIGLGYVDAACAAEGTALRIQTDRAELPVVVAPKPLYPNGTCRS